MTFQELVRLALARPSPWRIVGNRSAGAGVKVASVSGGTYTFQWGTEAKQYQYVFGSGGVSLGASWSPVAFSLSPSDLPSTADPSHGVSRLYLLTGAGDLVSTDIDGPFVSLSVSAAAFAGGYATLLFLGTANTTKAVLVDALLSDFRTAIGGLALFKALAFVAGTAAQSPGGGVDFHRGHMHRVELMQSVKIDISKLADKAVALSK